MHHETKCQNKCSEDEHLNIPRHIDSRVVISEITAEIDNIATNIDVMTYPFINGYCHTSI